jgi:phage tail protein
MADTDLSITMQLPANLAAPAGEVMAPADWSHVQASLYAPTIFNGAVHFLYQWGTIQFLVQPLNIHESDHESGTDWAQKEVVGGAIYREWVGENDEQLFIRGRVFPYRVGGFGDLQRFEEERRAGNSHPLIRGDGSRIGWFVCEKMVRAHTFLSGEGIGQQVAFEAVLVRVPMPDPAVYVTQVWKANP